ncbi:MAG: hypothetical protein ACRD2C_22935 [Acidimicrobiales bacterium]
MNRRIGCWGFCGVALTLLVVVVTPDPAAADHCQDPSDCFATAEALTDAVLGVIQIVGFTLLMFTPIGRIFGALAWIARLGRLGRVGRFFGPGLGGLRGTRGAGASGLGPRAWAVPPRPGRPPPLFPRPRVPPSPPARPGSPPPLRLPPSRAEREAVERAVPREPPPDTWRAETRTPRPPPPPPGPGAGLPKSRAGRLAELIARILDISSDLPRLP